MKNKILDRVRQKHAEKLLKNPESKFTEINIVNHHAAPKWMTRAFRNNRYTVMINDNAATTHGTAIRAMVQKHDNSPIVNHWSEMQRIKNEIFGSETAAVEYYPKESELTNDFNIYWMWIFKNNELPLPIKLM